jgi:hypothetical protein
MEEQTKEAEQKIGAEEEAGWTITPTKKEKTGERKLWQKKKKKSFFVEWWASYPSR